MAKKLNFLSTDPGEDVSMPQTKPVAKPLMTQEQILALIGGIQDPHDLCLMYVRIFCGPRASEVLGLQWKSWTGTTLVPYGTAFEGQFYKPWDSKAEITQGREAIGPTWTKRGREAGCKCLILWWTR